MEVKEMASKGGKARWKGKTAKQKSAHMKKMADDRWGKKLSTGKSIAKPKKV